MARQSLRKRLEGMEVDEVIRIPKDYEEATIRNVASVVGSSMGRKYSAVKDVHTKTFSVARIS